MNQENFEPEEFVLAVSKELDRQRRAEKVTYQMLVDATKFSSTTLQKFFTGKGPINTKQLSLVCSLIDVEPYTIFKRAEERLRRQKAKAQELQEVTEFSERESAIDSRKANRQTVTDQEEYALVAYEVEEGSYPTEEQETY